MLGSIRSEIIVAKWLRYHRSAMHIVCTCIRGCRIHICEAESEVTTSMVEWPKAK
jgi:hypothetical protein